MEPNTSKKDTREFVKNIPTWNFDLVSDFGQDEMRKKREAETENLKKQIVRFDESPERLINES